MVNKERANQTLYIIIPAYNEAVNLPTVVEDWYPVVQSHDGGGSSRLVVIDDGSTDDSLEVLRELAADRPLMEVLTKENGGHGQTLLHGYRYAIEQGADLIFQTDSDGQTDPAEFDAFRQAAEEYDAVLGNRVDRQDGASRKLVGRSLTSLLRMLFGVKLPDANAPFRLMKADLVKKYLPLLPQDYNLPNVMLSTFFVFYNEKAVFLPISFAPRQGGKNSLNMRKITKIGVQAIKDFKEIRRKMPPR